ncbi:pleckstrin homology domain-containing family G member 3 isoform X1 [Clupea harengus]|uniref:Pleckstrin homology domain-containing family G member 3 isoform X1 n=1 Tax=Clupea harengus TaxID=7950 RepID=A0A8M1KVJ3_CLUHA|nr:pleckstrin homology domain-containing family G member 3 isoform X1 [Clupea harengus]XP_042565619.1 pleckstrin homology domain-containing family G member 3 isoform X1 [Clupea harengus]XP_042565620.1 pleckstrin homology domain-containing family G member 3 isoform X1 [Clupea harengus]
MPEGTHCTLHTSQMGEESPRLSTGSSVGSHDPLSSVTAGDCCGLPCSEHSEDERPVSLVSTLSSSSSRDEVLSSSGGGTTPLPLSTPSHPPSEEEEDIDLHLSPPEAPGEPSSSGDACDSRDGDVHVPPAGRTPRKLSLPISPTRSPFATVAMAPNPQLTYLDRVVMEIIETEQMYVRDLCNIVEDYLAHIIDTGTMGPEQVSALFGNIEDIYEFNGELLQSLYMCNGDPVAIARCFVDRSEYFDIYTQYCTNYPNSVAALTECMRSKNLAKFFRDRQASLNLSLPLGSYLLKPVQRILKYHLLLQEIAKHFDPEEEGYEVVEEAIDTMTGVAWYINDMKRKHEHAVRLQEIQSLLINWKGPDLTTYGELVLEGTFHVHRAKNERTLFLFDKILLITKKRVEHFIYKTHISCSTLMLIGSAKDCLRFSVTHFKHRSKQPHTVQAKTLEEKKLWVHHIKRLILENHQAVIPQKAKEAILDIDSICPVKYRYSPERLKKPLSPQGEDFTGSGRQGRRRSEPAKQITKSTKAVLKHAESEGTLLVDSASDSCSLQPATSLSSLASNLSESQAPRPCLEDGREELGFGRDTEETLRCEEERSEGSLGRKVPELEVEPQETPQEERESEEKEEESLVVEDQVADFASSMLAAISCWHYRARALLFTRFTTDGEGCTAIEDQAAPGEGTQTLPEEEATETAMDETLSDQTPAEEGSPQDGSAWTASPVDNQRDIPRIHIEESSPLPPRCERITEAEECFRSMVAGQGDELDTSALIQEENSISSNGTFYEEGEEEEEEEEEAVAMGTGACSSILPSSVLDQASVIAERFASSLSRRNSLVVAADDFTPTSSHPCATSTQLVASSGDPSADAPILRPKADRSTPSLVELDRLYQSRQDSTLSKKDQLLIHKIRHYYEHAEHLDMGFSIKRRESLSFIPAGLVRHLSRQINSTPMDEIAVAAATAAGNRKGSPGVRPTSWSVFNLPGLDKRDEMPKSPAGGTEATRSAAEKRRTVSVSDATLQSEVFHSPSHIIPVWQDMETDMDGVQEDTESNTETKDDETASPTLHHKSFPSRRQRDADCGESLLIQEEDDDVSTVTDASCITPPPTFLSPTKEEARGPESTGSDEHLQRGQALRAPLPRVITLRSGLEEEQQQQILQDVEKVKNKVFQLARQYSQRIKNNRPVLKPRARETESPLTSVQEERTQRTETGTSGLVLSLSSYDQVVIQELKLPSPSPSISSAGSSRVQSPSGPPVSPVPVESFHWPDVRELRSKYAPGRTHGRRTGSGVGVSRSHSTPERMMMMVTESEAERSRSPLSRSSSTSSSCLSLEPRGSPTDYSSMAASDTCLNLGSDAQLLMGTAEEEGGGGSVSRLCGVNSLDTLHLNEQHQQQQQNNKVIAAETVSMPSTGSQGGRGIETTERDERDENVLNGGDGRSALELEAWRSLRRRDWRAYERLQSTTKYSTSSLKTLDGSQRSLVKNLREKFQSLSSYT